MSFAGEYVSKTDTVLRVSSSFRTENEVLKVLQEEILVHKGLGFVAPEDRQQLCRDIQAPSKGGPEVAAGKLQL